jgi:pyruvate/2-oxoacid:ferredoxin oxidoreductase alpha subunit
MEGLIVVIVVLVLVIVTIGLGVRIVPQGSKSVVQRLGKYHKTLGPGLNIIVPYMDRAAYRVTTKDIVLDIPSQEAADRYLPPYAPRIQLDPSQPYALGQMASPVVYMEMRQSIQAAMEAVPEVWEQVESEFEACFQRRHGCIEAVSCDDADIILVVSGTVASTCRLVVDRLRRDGHRVGMLKIKMFRPFPARALRPILSRARKIAVVDRNFSFGASGIFAQETRAALCNVPDHPPVFGFIAGLGGRDITPELLEDIYWRTHQAERPPEDSIWMQSDIAAAETQ